MLTEQELLIVSSLIEEGTIPLGTIFEVIEKQLIRYTNIYHNLFGKTANSLNSKSNVKFARRLAGRTLLKVNFSRGARFTDLKAGLVYLIENVSYPEHYKVGLTINLKQRLAQYQTYDPYRQFKITKYDFALDRYAKEKEILSHPDIYNECGEWIKRDNAIKLFDSLVRIPL